MAAMPRATLVCDKKCAEILAEHFDTSAWKMRIVATGETISLGRRTLQFIETPMVHWPESMFTYVPEEKLLFSMDAFGQHYRQRRAVRRRVAAGHGDGRSENILREHHHALRQIGEACLERIEELGHRDDRPQPRDDLAEHADKILAAYRSGWIARPQPKVLVIYDTMWESTAAMAQAILEGARSRACRSN